jgi:DNA primase
MINLSVFHSAREVNRNADMVALSARELKARVDLAAIAGQFTGLRRSGHQLVGLCPLHKEHNPSFFVHPEKQCFKCFGCGAGGDLFEFVMRATGCNFPRALEIVAEFCKGVASGSGAGGGARG